MTNFNNIIRACLFLIVVFSHLDSGMISGENDSEFSFPYSEQ